MTSNSAPLIAVSGLTMQFKRARSTADRLARRPQQIVHALNGVSFDVRRGETLGIVGESGCGKSTLARCLVRLYKPTAGQIDYAGADILALEGAARRAYHRRVQMVFQDPYSSLNPRMTVRQTLAEAIRFHGLREGAGIDARIAELLDLVRLPSDAGERYPHEFSGGQRQRIDLRLVRHISHRTAVMYLGAIVELADTESLFTRPAHPYTAALLKAAPELDPGKRSTVDAVRGELPSPINIPAGCPFHPRCAYAIDRCRSEPPLLLPYSEQHLAACHLAGRFAPADGIPEITPSVGRASGR